MKDFGVLQWLAYAVMIAGGINLGVFGLINLNLFDVIFGTGFLERFVNLCIGISAGYLVYSHFKKTPA